jgi:hypothetical protein
MVRDREPPPRLASRGSGALLDRVEVTAAVAVLASRTQMVGPNSAQIARWPHGTASRHLASGVLAVQRTAGNRAVCAVQRIPVDVAGLERELAAARDALREAARHGEDIIEVVSGQSIRTKTAGKVSENWIRKRLGEIAAGGGKHARAAEDTLREIERLRKEVGRLKDAVEGIRPTPQKPYGSKKQEKQRKHHERKAANKAGGGGSGGSAPPTTVKAPPTVKTPTATKAPTATKPVKFASLGKGATWSGGRAGPFFAATTYLDLHAAHFRALEDVKRRALLAEDLLSAIDSLERGAKRLNQAEQETRAAFFELPDHPLHPTGDPAQIWTALTPDEVDYVQRYYKAALAVDVEAGKIRGELDKAIDGWAAVNDYADKARDFTKKAVWEARTKLDWRFSNQGGSFKAYLVEARDAAGQVELWARWKHLAADEILTNHREWEKGRPERDARREEELQEELRKHEQRNPQGPYGRWPPPSDDDFQQLEWDQPKGKWVRKKQPAQR